MPIKRQRKETTGMKTYRTPGATATDWSPTGNSQEVSRIETYVGDNGMAVAVPVRLAMAGETTKKGVRRVMIKASGNIPATMLDGGAGINAIVDAKSTVPFSAHLVVQMPQVIAQIESGGNSTNGLTAIVMRLIRDLIAISTDESVTANADLSASGLLAHALAGDTALDIISGAYGESSARA
jgi:hypothetical protein